MLKGHILSLSWLGERGWCAELSGKQYIFKSLTDLDLWLCRVIENAQDRDKAKLLIEDRKKLSIPEMLAHE